MRLLARRSLRVIFDIRAVLGGKEAFDVWSCFGELKEIDLCKYDIATECADYSVKVLVLSEKQFYQYRRDKIREGKKWEQRGVQ